MTKSLYKKNHPVLINALVYSIVLVSIFSSVKILKFGRIKIKQTRELDKL